LAITGVVVVREGKSITFYADGRQEPKKNEYASVLQNIYGSVCRTETDNGQLVTPVAEPAEQVTTVVKY
jgi:hypothetical protein